MPLTRYVAVFGQADYRWALLHPVENNPAFGWDPDNEFRFAFGVLQHLVRSAAQAHLHVGAGHARPGRKIALQNRRQLIGALVQFLHDLRHNAVALPDQTQQEMFRLDRLMAQRLRQILGTEHCFLCFLGKLI